MLERLLLVAETLAYAPITDTFVSASLSIFLLLLLLFFLYSNYKATKS